MIAEIADDEGGLVVDSAGNFYVLGYTADGEHDRIIKLAPDGRIVQDVPFVGNEVLVIAAFFEGSTPIPGDANCNGRLDADDVTATVTAVFDPIAQALCDVDCNQDGAVTAADMTCVVELLAGPQQRGLGRSALD